MKIPLSFTTPITNKKNSKVIARWGNRSGIISNAKARDCEEMLRFEALVQARGQGLAVMHEPCDVRFRFRKNRCDLIGLAETVLDAMENAVYANDRQVRRLSMEWSDDMPDGVTCLAEVSF